MFSVLHLSSEEINTNDGPEIISAADLAQRSVDSVYNTLSIQERLNLLSVHPYSIEDSSSYNSDTIGINGFVFDPNVNSTPNHKASTFLDEQLAIASKAYDNSKAVNNLSIGQTGNPKLAFFNQAIQLENLKKSGANIFLGENFESFVSSWGNAENAFHQSPLKSEKYWVQSLLSGEANGIKIGIQDFFFKDRAVDKLRQSDFIAIGMSGNRYYARKGHGIIRLNEDLDIFQERFSRFKMSSRQKFLRKEMNFNGVIISEDFSALSPDEQVFKASESIVKGSDIVCITLESRTILNTFLANYFENRPEQLKDKCMKVLNLKLELHNTKTRRTSFSQYKSPYQYQITQAGLTCIKSEDIVLPINKLTDTISFFSSKENNALFTKQIGHYSPYVAYSNETANKSEICLLDGYGNSIDEAIRIATNHNGNTNFILITDAKTFHSKRTTNFSSIKGILLSPDTTELDKSLAIQAAFGAFATKGKLPFYHTPLYKQGHGLELQSMERLSYVNSEYLGIDTNTLEYIDKIAKEAINARALPGCQVMVGFEGKVVYEKNFGHHDYSCKQEVESNTIYDIASISKIAASTVSLMALQGQNKFSLYDSLHNFIPEVVENNPMKNIWLKDMMSHQAGLPAWIPFYFQTLSNKKPNPKYYSYVVKNKFETPVANNLWIRNDYQDTMYARILSCALKSKRYKYSDLGYYFVKKIIEKQGGLPMEDFVDQSIYKPLGLQTMTYNPYLKFPLSRIAPTENDKIFRKQTVHGYVHDPGSAMMGGVCGHAGVFSTANDLTILMQMLLNNGSYGGVQVLEKDIVKEYTSVQFPGKNRRGAGFDKPKLNGSSGTACSAASPQSFGHSGFTGTLTWADPKYKINYVFLSNRVNPSAENWKIVKMNIRTRIQSKIYQSIKNANNFDFLASI